MTSWKPPYPWQLGIPQWSQWLLIFVAKMCHHGASAAISNRCTRQQQTKVQEISNNNFLVFFWSNNNCPPASFCFSRSFFGSNSPFLKTSPSREGSFPSAKPFRPFPAPWVFGCWTWDPWNRWNPCAVMAENKNMDGLSWILTCIYIYTYIYIYRRKHGWV